MILKCVSSYVVIYLFVLLNVVECEKSTRLKNNTYCNTTIGRITETKYVNGVEIKKLIRKCCEGFLPKGRRRCIPNCDNVCENGKCIGNNVCECTKGYKILSPSRCIPECSNCEHGNCIAPEKCDCYPGYRKSDNETCVPECDPPCDNGECISQNKCKCYGSFKFINNTHCVPDDFILKQDMCVKACDHGICDESHQCICSIGYESHNGSCKMTCDKECINGKCINDQCACDNDFVEFNSTNCVTKEFIIERDRCKKNCNNGICSDLNECHCYDGFKYNKELTKCVPTCLFEKSYECINGKCVAPNECACLIGYELASNSDYRCDPVCENCSNGFCKAPGVCDCNKGFILEASGCYEEDNIEVEMRKTTEPDNISQTTTTILDDIVSTSDESVDEIESTTFNSFVPISSTEVINVFETDEPYQKFTIIDNASEYTSDVSESTFDYTFETEKSKPKIKTTTSSFDTSTIDESFSTSADTIKYTSEYDESTELSSTNNIEIDKVVTSPTEIATTSYDASFEETTTATNYDATTDPELDNSSLSSVTESSEKIDTETKETTDENDSSLNTTPLYVESSSNEIEIKNTSERDYTEKNILNSSSTIDILATLNDESEMTIDDITTSTIYHTTSPYSFYDKKSSTFKYIIHETTVSNHEYSESSINIEATSSESSFNFEKAEKSSINQESSSNRHNIDEKSTTTSSILMEHSNEIADTMNANTDAPKLNSHTIKVVTKIPLNVCEKSCDDGSCAINGECHKELNTLICNCINGACFENICICNQGFTLSSEDSSICIKEVQVILVNGPSEISKQSSLNPLYWLVLTPLIVACLFIIISILYKLRGPGKSYLIESQELSENCAYYVKAHSVDGSFKF